MRIRLQDDSEAVAIAAECSKLHNVDAEDADVALQANENITEDILVRDFAFTVSTVCLNASFINSVFVVVAVLLKVYIAKNGPC